MSSRIKVILFIFCLVANALIVGATYQTIVHRGKTAVVVSVIPKDAAVKIDGQISGSGRFFLKKGEHYFEAQKDGYKTSSQKIILGTQSQKVELLPEPESETALKALQSNPKEQKQRQIIGDKAAGDFSQLIRSKNPVIAHLPQGYNQQEFAIDYKQAADDPSRIVLLITGKTTKSRQYALQQIKEWGYDPTDYEIVFSDFNNPFAVGN